MGSGCGEVVKLTVRQALFQMLKRGAAVEEIADVIVADDERLAPLARMGRGGCVVRAQARSSGAPASMPRAASQLAFLRNGRELGSGTVLDEC